jgi:subtilase family serine protease
LSPHTSQGLAEFEQEYFYPSDITTFQQKYNLPQKAAKIIGKNDPNTGYLGEATLDVEYAFAMAPHADTWVWSFDAYDLVAWAVNVTSTPNAPKVHSVSYGTPEASYDAAFLKRTNSEFMKMATQGYSIMVASGDYGTGNTAWGPWCGPFSVYFPASSNWVRAKSLYDR